MPADSAAAPVGHDEQARLAALAAYGVLDTPPEPGFDRIAELAAELFQAPIALVSLVTRDRQWFKARVGLAAPETSRGASFCAHAVAAAGGAALVVPDARLDPRFRANPLVTGAPGIRFYAGAPLVAPSGHKLGTLCVIDRAPRPALTRRERAVLARLADLAVDRMELRRTERELRRTRALLDQMVENVPAMLFVKDAETGRFVLFNRAGEELTGVPREEALGRTSHDLFPPDQADLFAARDRAALAAGRAGAAAEEPADTPRRGRRLLRTTRVPVPDEEGRPRFLLGFSEDVTERRAAEERQALLVAELNHRVKNTLAVVLSVADQTRRATAAAANAPGEERRRFHADLRDRLHALARAHDLLTREAWQGAGLAELVLGATAPYDAPPGAPGGGGPGAPAAGPARIEVAGPAVRLAPEPAVAVALAFHELATNAAKYGALSRPAGRVTVAWAPTPDGGALDVVWTERGGPPVAGPPARRGFGSRLLERALTRQLGGTVAIDYAPEGVRCRLRVPFSARIAPAAAGPALAPTPPPRPPRPVRPRCDLEAAPRRRSGLHGLGVEVALDDFGAGHASFSYLKDIAFRRTKLDRCLIAGLPGPAGDRGAALVRHLVALAHGVGAAVVAEGVEDEAQRAFLEGCGCDALQGWLLGRPEAGEAWRARSAAPALAGVG